MQNNSKIFSLKGLLLFYWVTFLGLIIACNIYEPLTYSFSNFSIGIGRFSDYFNIFSYAQLFPDVGTYCITPWHLIFFANQKEYPWIKVASFILLTFISIYCWQKSFEIINKKNPLNISMAWMLYLYPLIFCFWRGNTELFAFSFLLLSLVWEYYYPKSIKSIIFYMIACFIKPNYFIFGLLFIKNILKKNKILLLLSVLIFTLIFYFSMALYNDVLYLYKESSSCLGMYKEAYIIGEGGTLFNNSYWGLTKIIYYWENQSVSAVELNNLFSIYWYSWRVIFIIVCIFAVLKYDFLEKCLIIMSSSIVLYPISADYRLITLIIPFILMSATNFAKYKIQILLLLLIMLPKHFLDIQLTEFKYDVTISSILNPVLISLLVFSVFLQTRKKAQ